MLKKRDFAGLLKLYDYKTKKSTGELKVIGKGFWGFFAAIGEFLLKIFGVNSPIVIFFAWVGSGVASFFGFKLSHETAVGLGFFIVLLIIFFSLAAYISYFYPEYWAYLVGLILAYFGIGLSE